MASELKYKSTLDTRSFDSGMAGMANKVGGMDNMMSKIAGGIGLASIGGKLLSAGLDFGKMAIDQLKKYEYFSASLKTMMHGDVAGAQALNSQLVNLAQETPFSLEDVQAGTKNLMAYGFQANEITDNLTMLGNVSSGVGAPLNDIIYLYGTLRASQRVTLMDIRQFAGRGIPIYEALQKTMHKTTTEILDMVKHGKLGFKDIETAFKSMTGPAGQFFNLMEEQSKTTAGQIDRLSDSWKQLGLVMAQSNQGVINVIVKKVGDIVGDVQTQVQLQNEKEAIEQKYGMSGQNWWKRNWGQMFSLGWGDSEDDKSKELTKSNIHGRNDLDLFSRSLASNDMEMVNYLRKKTAEDAANIQFRIEHKGLMERTTGREEDIGVLSAKGASLADTLSKMNSAIDSHNKGILNKKPEDGKLTGESELGLPTEYSGKRPQAINININELIGIKDLHSSSNTADDYEKSKENFLNILLEAVNDLNKISGKQ